MRQNNSTGFPAFGNATFTPESESDKPVISSAATTSANGSVPLSGNATSPSAGDFYFPAANGTAPAAAGPTNVTVNSVRKGKVESLICDNVIFKRTHGNLFLEGRQWTGLTPLSPEEAAADPPIHATEAYYAWQKRVQDTPYKPDEVDSAPAGSLKERRLILTPLTEKENRNPPPYGSPERELWRTRREITDREGDTYGHWWVEIYYSGTVYSRENLQNSYGYWPLFQLAGPVDTMTGVPGALNMNEKYDPHASEDGIDWNCDEAFHPAIIVPPGMSKEEARKKFIAHIESYVAEWKKRTLRQPGRIPLFWVSIARPGKSGLLHI